MAEDAGTEALSYRRAARKHAIGFLALLLGWFVLAFMMTRIAPPDPRGGIDWAAVAALAAAFGALATGLAAVSNLILARRAERRQARESRPGASPARAPGAGTGGEEAGTRLRRVTRFIAHLRTSAPRQGASG